MPNTDQLLIDLLVNSQLAHYPDKKLYNAATLLTPEERPTAPVQLNKRMMGATYNPNTRLITVGTKDAGSAYQSRHLRRLAALLAHEGVHSKGDPNEPAAYQQQIDTLKRLGETDKELLRILSERAAGGPIMTHYR